MSEARKAAAYTAMLRKQFRGYRDSRFADHDRLFESRRDGGPIVFRKSYAEANLLIPPFASPAQRQAVARLIPTRQRHRHFGSMQSSQALAQSIFGCMAVFDLLPLIANVEAECGRLAFGDDLTETAIRLEESVNTLGEPRATSLDVSLDRPRVAIECKLAETKFGTCSRPSLTARDAAYPEHHCDGSYTHQRGRVTRCSLSEIGVRYWRHLEALFGWDANMDHHPCPLASTYQLVRNVLAACVDSSGTLEPTAGHALIIYDDQNPAMHTGGEGDRQWTTAQEALRVPGILRRVSWRNFMVQWPSHPVLDWLRAEANAKYGFS